MAVPETSFDSFLMSQGCTRWDSETYVLNRAEKIPVLKEEADKRGIIYLPYERGQDWWPRLKESGWAFARRVSDDDEFRWFVAVVPPDNY